MNQENHNEDDAVVQQGEMDVMAYLRKIQQQLVFLERKVDTLIAQSKDRPSSSSFRDRPFTKPAYRSFSPSSHQGRGDRDSRSHGGRESSSYARPFDKRSSGEGQRFAPRKKPSFQKRNDR